MIMIRMTQRHSVHTRRNCCTVCQVCCTPCCAPEWLVALVLTHNRLLYALGAALADRKEVSFESWTRCVLGSMCRGCVCWETELYGATGTLSG